MLAGPGRKSTVSMNRMRSVNHTVDTVTLKKTGLCPVDDKSYLLEDTYTSLKYGHKDIPKV